MNLGELTPDLKVLIDAEIESSGGPGGGDVPFVGASPPDSPSDGELWWDTDDDTPVDGGSQTFKVVRFPYAFDTTGLIIEAFAITAVDQGTKTLTIAGDHASAFTAGDLLGVTGSTGNDGVYTVVSATFGTSTEIVVVEALPDNTVNGSLANRSTAGVSIYIPTPRDFLLYLSGSILTGFVGSDLNVWVFRAGDDFVTVNLVNINSIDVPDGPFGSVSGMSTPNDIELQKIAAFFDDDTPLKIVMSDSVGGNPGAVTDGEGEIILNLDVAS